MFYYSRPSYQVGFSIHFLFRYFFVFIRERKDLLYKIHFAFFSFFFYNLYRIRRIQIVIVTLSLLRNQIDDRGFLLFRFSSFFFCLSLIAIDRIKKKKGKIMLINTFSCSIERCECQHELRSHVL